MKLRLKEGKGKDIIKTDFGGVGFIEGDIIAIDETRIKKEELSRIKKDYDIVEGSLDKEQPKVKDQKPKEDKKEQPKVKDDSEENE